jgi:hypothetical protein
MYQEVNMKAKKRKKESTKFCMICDKKSKTSKKITCCDQQMIKKEKAWTD